jgi:hypothetical protein
VPDRDLFTWLPQVELADLPRPVDRALKRPGHDEERADLAQVVIDDRLAAVEPQRRDQLADPLPRHRRVALQQPVDLVLERIELRARRRTLILRRHRRTQRRPDRVARQARPPHQLVDRDATHEVLPAQFGPPLHTDQPLSPPLTSTVRSSESPDPPGRLRQPSRGSDFDRRRGVSFQPAPTRPVRASWRPTPTRSLPRRSGDDGQRGVAPPARMGREQRGARCSCSTVAVRASASSASSACAPSCPRVAAAPILPFWAARARSSGAILLSSAVPAEGADSVAEAGSDSSSAPTRRPCAVPVGPSALTGCARAVGDAAAAPSPRGERREN